MAQRKRRRVYGVNQPTVDTSPAPVQAQRDPRTDDFAPFGTIWTNQSNGASYVITQIVNNQATWRGIGGAAQRLNNEVRVLSGNGDPNGTVTAPVGSFYLNTNPTGTTDRIFVNTDGATGWTYAATNA